MTDTEKPQSWPLNGALPAYVDNSHPSVRPGQNPDTVREIIRPDNGAFMNVPAGNRRMNEPPTWVLRNLLAAKITVFIMFVIGPVLCAFGLLMRDDLSNDKYDFTCENNYIARASEPWDRSMIDPPPGYGRYHSDCRLLYHWSRLLVAAGSISIFRPLLQAVPVYEPASWTFKFSRDGKVANLHSPARAYVLRTIFSAVPAVLYLVLVFILGTSKFITGPETTEEWYRPIYLVCLSLICVAFVLSLHQAMSTGVGAWYLRGFKKIPHGFRPTA